MTSEAPKHFRIGGNRHSPAKIVKWLNHSISVVFKLSITPFAGNLEPSNGDMGGPRWENNKSKMVAATFLEKTQKGASRPIFGRFAPDLVCKGYIWSVDMVDIRITKCRKWYYFLKFKMVVTPILELFLGHISVDTEDICKKFFRRILAPTQSVGVHVFIVV